MKLPFITILALFPCVASAADQAAPVVKPLPALTKPAPVIVNGKKFFPLNNVRRFTSSGPSSLQVMHHPRSGAIVSSHSMLSHSSTQTGNASAVASTSTPIPPAPALQPASASPQAFHGPIQPAAVLSVFTPEEPAPAR